MTHLVAPFRHPPQVAAPTGAPLVVPMYPAYQSVQYNKITREIPAGTMANSRQFGGTFAYRAAAAPSSVQWPYVYGFGDNTGDGNATPMRLCYDGNNGQIYLLGRRISDATVIYNQVLIAITPATNGTINRVAFKVDLDNLANCKTWINGVPTTWPSFGGDDTITPEWSLCTMGTILGNPAGAGVGFPVASGVWTAMMSFSPNNDLDVDAVFDDNGFFTDPGEGFRGWYGGNKPAFGFYSGPYKNHGYLTQLSGMRFNHPTPLWHQMESSTELRAQLTGVADGAGYQVNEGIGY